MSLFQDLRSKLRAQLPGSDVTGLPSTCRGGSAGPSASTHVQLQLPWAGRRLCWHVMFSCLPPFSAPDFIFDDETFQPLIPGASLSPQQLSHLQALLRSWPQACSAAPGGSAPSSPSGGNAGAATPSGLLLNIIQLLLDGFNHHQHARMAQHPNERLHFELSTLPSVAPSAPAVGSVSGSAAGGEGLQEQGGGPSQQAHHQGQPRVELLYTEGLGSEQPAARMRLPLEGLDFKKLAEVLEPSPASSSATPLVLAAAQGAPGAGEQHQAASQLAEQLAQQFKLQVVFKLGGSGNSDPELSLVVPLRLQGAGGFAPPQLPTWTPHMCLMEYVPALVERLQQSLAAYATSLQLQKQLLEAMGPALGGADPLELNPAEGAGLWYVAWEGQPVLLSLQCTPSGSAVAGGAGPGGAGGTSGATSGTGGASGTSQQQGFPEDMPLITLTAVRQLGVGGEGTRSYRGYPWSPRWPPAEMASRIASWLASELPVFLGIKPAGGPIAPLTATATPTPAVSTGGAV